MNRCSPIPKPWRLGSEKTLEHTITDLKWCRSQPDRVMVHVDGQPCAKVSLVAAGRLSVGDRVNADIMKQWQADQGRREAYLYAVRVLGARDHSRHELRQKLRRQGFGQAAIDAVTEKLMDQNYLDDQVYAASYVASRMKTSPRSRRLMAQELKRKGIRDDHIEAALKPVDERRMALACIHRKRRRWRRFEGQQRRMKMLAHLSSKGFSYDVSRRAVETYCAQAD
jgi:regulatory protein